VADVQAWYATFVLMVAYTLSYIDRQILSMLVEPIKQTCRSAIRRSACCRASRSRCSTRWSASRWGGSPTAATAAASSPGASSSGASRPRSAGSRRTYGQLFLARVGVGVGEAALGPAAYSMIADYFPPEQRGRALGVYSMGVYLGIGLAAIIGGVVVGGARTTAAAAAVAAAR
jgi:MFS family permease